MFTVKVDAGFQGFEATVKLVTMQAFTITLKLSDCVAAVGQETSEAMTVIG